MKDLEVEELKVRTGEVTLFQYIYNAETSKKAWKEKKKSWCNQKKNQENSIPASEVNIMESRELKKKKNKNWKYWDRDLSTITYYNYDKKDYYVNICPNLLKN